MPIAVLTDGLTWIIFKTFIPGVNFKSKEAFVFPSFEAVVNNFSIFYELLSRDGFSKRLYNSLFDEIHNNRLLLNQDLVSPFSGNDIKLLPKSDLAFDLEKVFSNFFSRLAGNSEKDLLIECFVETRESRIADFSLEKITTNVLGNILPQGKNVDVELASLIRSNVEIDVIASDSGQTIFIVGPTGAGKTTFLDRFFTKTLPRPLRRKCALLKVNCLDATGREETALKWMTEVIIKQVEKQIYSEGSPTWDELLGLYIGAYKRRIKGVDAQLYKNDKKKFKEKFGVYLDKQVETDREGYLKRLLLDVVQNRKMLPIFLIDNIDEFSNQYKEKLFQFIQSLKRHAKHCLVIFPVTDKSAWSFSKTDIYGIYKSRSFFLPTPSPKEVFKKRIDFLKMKLSEEGEGKLQKGKYFSERGIKISIEDLAGFAEVLENIFVDQDYTSKTIGELTNYNIRRTLALSQRVITSSVIKIDDLIKSYLGGEAITTNFTKFMDSLMKGSYEIYKPEDNPEIHPVFQVDNRIRQSPLLKLRILVLLNSQRRGSKSIEEKHLDLISIGEYFGALGCREASLDSALLSLLESGLIEPFDISNRDLTSDQKLSISYRGMAHLRLALNNNVFFFQMALTTAITNKEIALRIRTLYKGSSAFSEKLSSIKNEFVNFILEEDGEFIEINSELKQYDGQRELVRDINKFAKKSHLAIDELVATLGNEYLEGVVKKAVTANVDFYDKEKGFGFAEVEGMDSKVYIHADKLIDYGIDVLKDGDAIICDIERNTKGFAVNKLCDVQTESFGTEIVECKIIRLFPERGYGFIKVNNSGRTAFFHVSIFPEELRRLIEEGKPLTTEIAPSRNSEGYQAKQVLKYDGVDV